MILKKDGLDNDFCFQYTLDDFKQYVTKDNYQHYDEFKHALNDFKNINNNTFTFIILNWQIFDNNKLNSAIAHFDAQLTSANIKYDQLSDKDFKQLKTNIKSHFNKIYQMSANLKRAESLCTDLSKIATSVINNSLYDFYFDQQKLQQANTKKDISAKILFSQQIKNYIQFLKTGHRTIIDHNKGGAYSLPLQTCYKNLNGCLIFLNRNLLDLNNLEFIHQVLNHELDHYFQMTIKGSKNKFKLDDSDKKTIETSTNSTIKNNINNIKYLFNRTEFQSHATDVCNYMLTKILPIAGKNAKDQLINAIKIYSKTYDLLEDQVKNLKLSTIFSQQIKKWLDWNKITQKINIQFASTAYKFFPQKWKSLKERLDKDFKKYQNMTQQQQKQYAQSLKKKFTPYTKQEIKTFAKLRTSKKLQKQLRKIT